MVEISFDRDKLVVEVLGWSKLWCLKSRLEVPLNCVRNIRADGDLPRRFWLRLPGTYVPGLIKTGSFSNGRRWSFWDVLRRRDDVVAIELSGWKYDFIVVEVSDPARTVANVRGALQGILSVLPALPPESRAS
jgi:hypothetical protein